MATHLSEFIARRTGGLFGRQPDYVTLFYLGMLDIRRDFSQGNADCERNIETGARRCSSCSTPCHGPTSATSS